MGRIPSIIFVSALIAGACSAGESETATPDTVSEPEVRTDGPALSRDETDEYPDAAARRFWRLAAEPRPVENSAVPPRHLDTAVFPESLIDRTEIVFAGRLPDQIPAIDEPRFAAAHEIDWLEEDEAVLVLQLGSSVRAYPIQVLMWHEIVNDVVEGTPVAVTYCPLCNSGVAFDRDVGDEVLDFGTSGSLYKSALVMYDRQTETLWTHFDGRAVVGTMVGTRLDLLPLSTVSWSDFREAHPDAPVLTRDTGFGRSYGRNPYVSYDSADSPLTGYFTGEVDDRQPEMARVVGINVGSDSIAVPLSRLRARGVVALEVAGEPATIWHQPGTASSLDAAQVADGADVGAVGVFRSETTEGRATFTPGPDGSFVDDLTGSSWNILGEAVDGPRTGERLDPITHVDTFWFAWSSYRPETTIEP